jgi:ATP-binding cassette subfamily B protein
MTNIAGSMHSLAQDAAGSGPAFRRGTIKRILDIAAPDIGSAALFLGLLLAESGLTAATPLVYRQIINHGVLGRRMDIVLSFATLAVALSLLEAGVGLAQSYVSARIGNAMALSLRVRLFAHVQTMPLAFFARTRTGALVTRLENDVAGAQLAFVNVLSNVVGNILSAVLILGAMIALSWQITAISLALLALIIFPARILGRKLRALTTQNLDRSAALSNIMVERFNTAGAQLVNLFGQRDAETRGFSVQAQRLSDVAVTRAVYGRILFAMLILMTSLTTAVVYGWGGLLALRGTLDIGSLVALVAYLHALYGPFTSLSNAQMMVGSAIVSFERLFEVLDFKPAIVDKIGAIGIGAGPATVAFEHVDFRYPAASESSLASLQADGAIDDAIPQAVLHDVSFTVGPGELVALVGPSGAGKTTITQLVGRFYDPLKGSVRINGIDLRDAQRDGVLARIGMVTQEPYLFHDTVRANLRYARPDATDAALLGALQRAQLSALIEALPAGLDTLVGERGYNFSGGERQRLAIARIFLKEPDIVVLDEATAHLDSGSESAVQAALALALEGRTSIVVAHRLSTILRANTILVLDHGRIVERGTHAVLLAKDGLYADLYRRQFSASERPSDTEHTDD